MLVLSPSSLFHTQMHRETTNPSCTQMHTEPHPLNTQTHASQALAYLSSDIFSLSHIHELPYHISVLSLSPLNGILPLSCLSTARRRAHQPSPIFHYDKNRRTSS